MDRSQEELDGETRFLPCHPKSKVQELRHALAEAREMGHAGEIARIHAAYTYRMHDLSEFTKALLQRFSSWFNR